MVVKKMVQKAVAGPARLSYQGETLFSISFPLFMLPVSFHFLRLRSRFRFPRRGFRLAFRGCGSVYAFYGSGFVSLSVVPDVIVLP